MKGRLRFPWHTAHAMGRANGLPGAAESFFQKTVRKVTTAALEVPIGKLINSNLKKKKAIAKFSFLVILLLVVLANLY